MTRDEARMWLDAEYPNLSAILIGCVSGHHTEWPAMRPELVRLVEEIVRLREVEISYRKQLWLNHGHQEALYGDDGEMQCVNCLPYGVSDYKRQPLELVEQAHRAACFTRIA